MSFRRIKILQNLAKWSEPYRSAPASLISPKKTQSIPRVQRFWFIVIRPTYCQQEAQLSQRDRARYVSLSISLSHSRSLKIIRNDTVE